MIQSYKLDSLNIYGNKKIHIKYRKFYHQKTYRAIWIDAFSSKYITICQLY